MNYMEKVNLKRKKCDNEEKSSYCELSQYYVYDYIYYKIINI